MEDSCAGNFSRVQLIAQELWEEGLGEKARTIAMGYRSQAKLPHYTAKGPEDGDSGLLWGPPE